MAVAPLNYKKPVKIFTYKLVFYHEDGSVSEALATSAQRSIVQNALDRLVDVMTPNTGQGLTKVEVHVGNGLDTAAK